MGGGVAVTYAGTIPERVWALVSVEGLGVPDSDPDSAAERMRVWIEDLGRAAARPRRPLSLAAAARRLREGPFRFSAGAARHMAEHGTRRDGTRRRWKFDPLHQTRSPQPYYVAQARAFWRRVTCPALYLEGGDSPLRPPAAELANRLRILRARRLVVDGARHHPHLERPEAFTAAILPFLHAARPR
jgi:pimeloyl-ACP methyl ester carboxylesterase